MNNTVTDIETLILEGESEQIEFKSSAFYLTGIIEKYGSGLTRIRRAVAEAANVVFSMQELPNGFLVTFLKMKQIRNSVDGGVNGGVSGVLAFIKSNPGAKTRVLMEEFNVTKRTLERMLKELREQRKIVFTGPSKTGGYHVPDNDL